MRCIKAACCCLFSCHFVLEKGMAVYEFGREGTWMMQNKCRYRRMEKTISTENATTLIALHVLHFYVFVTLAKFIRMGCTPLHAIHMLHTLRDMNRASKHRACFTWQWYWIWRHCSHCCGLLNKVGRWLCKKLTFVGGVVTSLGCRHDIPSLLQYALQYTFDDVYTIPISFGLLCTNA